MKTKKILILPVITVIFTSIAIIVFFSMNSTDTVLEFRIQDSVSNNWIWDSTITLQNRTIRGYYQTDRGPVTYRFTHLKPGNFEITISAPSYETRILPVKLKKGLNTLDSPIELIAYEIPNLAKFIIFEEFKNNSFIQELRPVGKDGKAILNHPCMNLQLAAMISVQTRNGIPVQVETDSGSERGDYLFRGKIDWTWDPLPETYFRYSSQIPGSMIKKNNSPYLVIDYLILIPIPGKISDKELEQILLQAVSIGELKDLQTFLKEADRDRFKYYFTTSWNVPGGKA